MSVKGYLAGISIVGLRKEDLIPTMMKVWDRFL